MTAPERMEIVVATDANYALPTAVTLRSIGESTPGPILVRALHDGVDFATRARIERSVAGDVALDWIDLSTQPAAVDTSQSHLPRAACFRLSLGSLLPGDVGRCLYLDVDLLVTGSLRPLWNVDLGDHTAAAVRSVNFPSIATRGAFDHWRALELDPRGKYFNSGVVLLDLDRWRDRRLEQAAFDHLRSRMKSGPNLDQNAWNYVLHGDWLELDPTWNQQTPLLDDQHGAHLLYDDETVDRVRREPSVIHFLDRPKPWQHGCTHPSAGRWIDLAADTAFGGPDPHRPTAVSEARRRIRRAGGILIKGR